MGKVVDTLVLDNEEDFQKMLHKLAEEILDNRPLDWYHSYIDSGTNQTRVEKNDVSIEIDDGKPSNSVMDKALKCAKDSRECKGSADNHTPSVKSHAFQVMFDLMDFIEQTDLDLWLAEILESVETIEELWKLKDSLAEHIRARARAVPPGSIDKAWP